MSPTARPNAKLVSILASVSLAVASVWAQEHGRGDPYRPGQNVSGAIRVWGHGSPATDFMGALVRSWEQGFRRYQPAVEFDNRLYGTASAIGALYAEQGD